MRNPLSSCVHAALAYLCAIVILIGGLAGNASGQCALANINSEPSVSQYAIAIEVSGTTAYAWIPGGRGDFLEVIDVADPVNPVQLSFTDIGGFGFNGHLGMVVSGSRLYLADYNQGLKVIDISNPTAPAILGTVAMPANSYDVAVSDTVAYMANNTAGLQVIAVSDPDPLNWGILGSVDTPGEARGVTVSGSVAYVADGFEGLQVIDVSDPDPLNWNILGSVDTPGFAQSVTVSGTTAYVADGLEGLQVIDVSDLDPLNWNILGSVGLPSCSDGAIDVTLSGDRVYIAYGGAGLQVADVSNPAAPFILASVARPGLPGLGTAMSVAVSGTVAYVVGNNGMFLQFIDLGLCQLGACCVEGVCVDLLSEANCLALGGTFFGSGSSCATSDCSDNSCGGAIPIALGDTPFTTIGATTDGPGLPECDPSFPLFENDIWYTYLPLTTGTLTVSTCGQADFDTKIAAYAGGCSVLSLIACAEDSNGCGVTSSMDVPVTAGEEILIRVGAYQPFITGSGTLSLTLASCPADITGPGGIPDGFTDVLDLIDVLAAWGACP